MAGLNGSGVILKADGTLNAWGLSNITNFPANLTNVVAVAQGPTATYGLALKSDGKVVVWSAGSSVTNVPTNLSNVVSIAAGTSHCLALKSDGLIASWGDNTSGQRSIPASLYSSYPTTKPVAIAAGRSHSVALRSDGVVFAWGDNSSGQTNVPALAKNGVVAIAAGEDHSIALRTNGVVVAWGQSDWGQITPPSNLSNVVAISAGWYHCIALVGNRSASHAFADNPFFSSNVFSLSIPTQCGRVYELNYITSFTSTNWINLPYVAGNGTNVVITDSTATNSSRFYRVRRW